MRALVRLFGVFPTVGHHLVDVQPGLFPDSTTSASVSRPAAGTSSWRAAPASRQSDTAATAVAGAPSGVSRMLDYQRLHSESLGSELVEPALRVLPHPFLLAKVGVRRGWIRSRQFGVLHQVVATKMSSPGSLSRTSGCLIRR